MQNKRAVNLFILSLVAAAAAVIIVLVVVLVRRTMLIDASASAFDAQSPACSALHTMDLRDPLLNFTKIRKK